MTDQTETARHLLDRHGLPEDVIDGALALFAFELAGKIRAHRDHTRGAVQATKVMDFAADLISPDKWAHAEASAGVASAADQTERRDRYVEALVDALKPRYGGPQHNVPGGLPLTATAEEVRLYRARPLVDAVMAVADAEQAELRSEMERRTLMLRASRDQVSSLRAELEQPPVVAPAVDRAGLRDRIRRAVCEAEGFAWDSDMLEPDEYGDHADTILNALLGPIPDGTDTATWTAIRAVQLMNEAAQEREAHRLALSQVLGLGTGAPWDAIHERVAVLSVVPDPASTRAVVLAEAADECDKAGAAYAGRALNDHAAGAFALMETFLRKADEAEYVATPCSVGGCEPGGEPCSTHERLMAHGEGDHELCQPDCDPRRLADETQPEPRVQCWHTEPGTPCDWDACRQPERLAAGDRGTDPAGGPTGAEQQSGAAPAKTPPTAYSDGMGHAYCLRCAPDIDDADVELTANDVESTELCDRCDRNIYDVADAAPAKEA